MCTDGQTPRGMLRKVDLWFIWLYINRIYPADPSTSSLQDKVLTCLCGKRTLARRETTDQSASVCDMFRSRGLKG